MFCGGAREATPSVLTGMGTRIAVDAGLTYLGAATLPATAIAVGAGSAVASYNRENKIRMRSSRWLVDRHISRHETIGGEEHSWLGKMARLPKKAADGLAHGMEHRIAKKAYQVHDRRGLLESVANVVTKLEQGKLDEIKREARRELGRNLNPEALQKAIEEKVKQQLTDQTKEFYLNLGKKYLRTTEAGEQVKDFALKKMRERLTDLSMAHMTAGKYQEVKEKANEVYMAHYRAYKDLSPEMDKEMRSQVWSMTKSERETAGKKTVKGVAVQQLWKGPLKYATGAAIAPKVVTAWEWTRDTIGIDMSGLSDLAYDTWQAVRDKTRDVWEKIPVSVRDTVSRAAKKVKGWFANGMKYWRDDKSNTTSH